VITIRTVLWDSFAISEALALVVSSLDAKEMLQLLPVVAKITVFYDHPTPTWLSWPMMTPLETSPCLCAPETVTTILTVRMTLSVSHGTCWSAFQDVRVKVKKPTIIASPRPQWQHYHYHPLRKKENSWAYFLF
jgi:hypothetical protein